MYWVAVLAISMLAMLAIIVGAYSTYELKSHWTFPWLMVGASNTLALSWVAMVRLLDEHRNVFIIGFVWDLLIVGIYATMPFWLGHLRMSMLIFVGLMVTISGIAILQWATH